MTADGTAVGRAVVTRVWGSAPRAEGACLLADAAGRIAGSVSGGCIESAAAEEIATALKRGTPRLVSYGVSNEEAWNVGLACGGTIEVFIEPGVRPQLVEAIRAGGGTVIATVVGGTDSPGASVVVTADGSYGEPVAPLGRAGGGRAPDVECPPAVRDRIGELALEVMERDQSRTATVEGPDGPLEVFLELAPRAPKLVIFGGVHIAIPLVKLARTLGYRTVVADAREAFLAGDRFSQADEVIHGWPRKALAEAGLDAGTSVVVLSHDPKLDDPALEIALRSPARYVGALGSRRTQAARRKRLLEAGVNESQLARLAGPVGLDLGGRAPAEIALAIMAEIIAVRHGKVPLPTTGGET